MKNETILSQHQHIATPELSFSESGGAVLINEYRAHPSGTALCKATGMTPSLVSKKIGEWLPSRGGWCSLLACAMDEVFDRALKMLFVEHCMRLNTGQKSSFLEKLDVSKVVQMAGIAVMGEVGEAKEELPIFMEKLKKILEGGTVTEIAKAFLGLQILREFGVVIEAHDSESAFGQAVAKQIKEKGGKALPSQPTMESILRILRHDGIGRPEFKGAGSGFGWDGDPESLPFATGSAVREIFGVVDSDDDFESLDEDSKESFLEGMKAQVLKSIFHFSSSDPQGNAIGIFSIPRNKMQDSWRNMNWHLKEEEFKNLPTSNLPKLEDHVCNTSRESSLHPEIFYGQNPEIQNLTRHQEIEDVSYLGPIHLGKDFQEFAQHIGKVSGAYNPHNPNLDCIWLNAITRVIGQLVNNFGCNGAAILKDFVTGYLAVPTMAMIDLDEEQGTPTEIMESIRAKDPIVLAPIYSISQMNIVREEGEEREAFISVMNSQVFPEFSREEVVAIVKETFAKWDAYLDFGKSFLPDQNPLEDQGHHFLEDFVDHKATDWQSTLAALQGTKEETSLANDQGMARAEQLTNDKSTNE